ncbi:MAG TPA: type I polyketide synthase, partial [Solirubrobacterales bacterium]|nr:type I polyketide synthase [Solirubrobacterales bacterium]
MGARKKSILHGGSGLTKPAKNGSQIAVVGLSCRLPGAPDPEAFWRLLASGEDAIGGMPAERWEMAGRSFEEGLSAEDSGARFGAFLDQVDRFDPAFFDISPREAAAMDPQQRLVLELGWEALEDAGVAATAVRGHPAGVFLGAIAGDYGDIAQRRGSDAAGRHTVTGLQRSIIANRVSYALGLTGPSLTVDAAQSSSLVAVHLACESLRSGESELALAGGVHLNIDPGGALSASRFGGLSPEGRCYTFDKRANGYVRGEGGGVVVLKPLAAARADGDRIYCVIRGSAVNNDGGGDGLTVPSRRAQERVLKRAYKRAGLKRSEVDYVELHGSGTAVGDPVEAAALGAALGCAGRGGEPLPVGSVKTNIGHLEGAAGVAGLIKMALAFEREMLPASLNFESPNPEIPVEELGLRVQGALTEWRGDERALVAGVSSFGMGGTNCHLVLSGASSPLSQENLSNKRSADDGAGSTAEGRASEHPLPGQIPLALSAKSPEALRDSAARLISHLRDNPELELDDVAYSLARSRSAFEHRAVAVDTEREGLLASLEALAQGADAPGLVRGIANADQQPTFLFPGQGSQWLGMAAALRESSALFKQSLEECEEALSPHLDFSLRDVLTGADGAASIERIEVVQPALFATMVSLARLWRACGVHPAATVGHSQGEIAAAHVSGGLSLEDAARIAALRSQLIARLVGQGAMVSVALSAAEAAARIEPWADQIELAAQNGPASTILSAEREAVTEFLVLCERDGIRAREIPATIPSHSAHVEPLREELLEALAPISPRSGEIPFYSTVIG